jgi:adenylate cyclase
VLLQQLGAILVADMVGNTQMMADDNATLVGLKILPERGSRASVGLHDGRIFKTMGDGFPVEFASVVEAVACAGDIQRVVAARNLRLEC